MTAWDCHVWAGGIIGPFEWHKHITAAICKHGQTTSKVDWRGRHHMCLWGNVAEKRSKRVIFEGSEAAHIYTLLDPSL